MNDDVEFVGEVHGVCKVTKDLRSGRLRGKKRACVSPFSRKKIVISTWLIYENLSSHCGAKEFSPLAWFGAEPQKTFAHAVG